MAPKLSLIIPTIGRMSLVRTLDSLLKQPNVTDGDEIILVADGCCVNKLKAMTPLALAPQTKFLTVGNKDSGHHMDGGAKARSLGQRRASGDWLIYCDDDDAMVPVSAFDIVRRAVENAPMVPHVFKMVNVHSGQVYPTFPGEVSPGNFGTPCLCVPNIKGSVPDWPAGPPADWHFMQELLKIYPEEEWIFRPEVTSLIWPSRGGRR